jgi:5'-deoxynucleotidase YfbR-like HD superfamily hydrolase
MPPMDRIALLYRAGEVKRLHTVYTQHVHTIAEHVYGSQVLALELCRLNKFSEASTGRVLHTLLIHDAAEVWTGDWPAPIKREKPELKDLDNLFEALFFAKQGIDQPKLNEEEEAIVKACDTLDLAMVCMREKLMGNRSNALAEVFSNCMEYIEAQSWVLGVTFLKTQIEGAWNGS